MLIFCTRRDQDETVAFFYVRDKTKTSLNSEFQARLWVSVSFSTRPRQEPSFNEENGWILALLFFKTTLPDQFETETRVSKIEANKMRPRQDCLKNFHPRQDRDETTSKILFKTGTRPRVSVHLVSSWVWPSTAPACSDISLQLFLSILISHLRPLIHISIEHHTQGVHVLLQLL